MRRTIQISLLILCSLTLWMWIEGLYWQYYPHKPVEIHAVTVSDFNVCAGMYMNYEVDLTRHQNAVCTISKELVNSYRISYEPTPATSGKLGRRTVRQKVFIPVRTDPDEWHLRVQVICKVGPNNREVKEVGESNLFNIVDCGRNDNRLSK